jgi:hypothetical protein
LGLELFQAASYWDSVVVTVSEAQHHQKWMFLLTLVDPGVMELVRGVSWFILSHNMPSVACFSFGDEKILNSRLKKHNDFPTDRLRAARRRKDLMPLLLRIISCDFSLVAVNETLTFRYKIY